MKVVLFCGGLGTRLREYSETIPKPLANIGLRPIIWHLMKYYAEYGHKEFVLCLGYKGEMIKDYFLKYQETVSNNFVLSNSGEQIELLDTDISDWKITFIDTGQKSNIGQRLKAIEKYVADDEYFLANYSDGLTDLDLAKHINQAKENKAIASFVMVRPSLSFHAVEADDTGLVKKIHLSGAENWINGGFFVLHKSIFDYIKDGEELVEQPFERLIKEEKLYSFKYKGFWSAMDTFKDKKELDSLYDDGSPPWMIWKNDKSKI
ncbi:MAG: sugar phosphate nucleotidyltransferase [Pseudomonadota bacterium]